MLPFALPFLPMLLAAGGALAYGEWQRKRGQDSSNTTPAATAASDASVKDKVTNVYNYNGLDDSTLGRTLFNTSGTTQNKMVAGRNKTLFS